MKKTIYLDNCSDTKPFKEVSDYICKTMNDSFGNPSSMHSMGIEAENIIKEARKTIAKTLKCSTNEIYFTSGGTESNNLAIRGYLSANKRQGKHILTSKIEHPSVLNVFEDLKKSGYDVEYLDVDENGVIKLETLKKMIRSDTVLLSIIYINNEIGTIQSIGEITKLRDSINKKLCIHLDAVQAYGKIRISPKRLGIQMLSVSSHKIHGPKGCGAIFIDEKIKIKPLVFGGGQERNIRPGSENVPGIAGFGMASEIINSGIDENYNSMSKMKKMFVENLKKNFDDIKINSNENGSPYILNVSFLGVKAEVLLNHLNKKNIYVSTGSACSSRKSLQSHVLKAIGLRKEQTEGAIRFSFSSGNTESDIIKTIEALKEIIPQIKMKNYRGDVR
ncbi:MAG: cysteine desulfurase family protein [Clostridia bacterium]|jgi:cysteine desulfurase